MAQGFRRSRGKFTARLGDDEREILAALFTQTADLLRSAAPVNSQSATDDEFERMMRAAGLVEGTDAQSDSNAQSESDADARGNGAEGDGPAPDATYGAGEDLRGDERPSAGGGLNDEALAADPALGRLLPDAHHGDPVAAAEFRAWSADGVRRAKMARLEQAAAVMRPDGHQLRLVEDDAVAVLIALTDVRLVLAERMGMRTEEDAEELEERIRSGEATQEAQLILTYDFLTWLQETLAGALDD